MGRCCGGPGYVVFRRNRQVFGTSNKITIQNMIEGEIKAQERMEQSIEQCNAENITDCTGLNQKFSE